MVLRYVSLLLLALGGLLQATTASPAASMEHASCGGMSAAMPCCAPTALASGLPSCCEEEEPSDAGGPACLCSSPGKPVPSLPPRDEGKDPAAASVPMAFTAKVSGLRTDRAVRALMRLAGAGPPIHSRHCVYLI